MKLFKRRYTPWLMVMSYENQSDYFIVLCRKNFKTGMLYFKTKKINATNAIDIHGDNLWIDTTDALSNIIEEEV